MLPPDARRALAADPPVPPAQTRLDVRREALGFAVDYHRGSSRLPSLVVETAEAFRTFLDGGTP